ncbi:WxL domain-containing protein [Actinacidiphila oryziradicis]|uniref:Beta-xylosidase n=1 Tax=Actinacidiphila oryziradicis TaxID=2571141 RepID=A0A4U0SPF7_9ACTN|nr:beta-xylosidase [Actinacidiphila oryziradicis]TKA10061.1 beta-xylosidase [Actinacidiphila oryziradicis]
MIVSIRSVAKRRRGLIALLGAAALAVGGGTVFAVPACAATAVTFSTHVVPPSISGVPAFDADATAQITVDNATPKVGDTVTVTYDVITPPANNPTTLDIPAGTVLPSGKVVLNGDPTKTVAVTGTLNTEPVLGKAAFPPFKMTGTFTVTDPGPITLSPGDINIHTSYILPLDTVITVNNPPAPVSETITATPATTPNNRAITLGSDSGAAGASVTVTGSGFTPGATVTVAGVQGTTATGEATPVTASGSGGISATLAVSDLHTTGIIAFEGATYDAATAAGPVAYTVIDNTPTPPGSQKLTTSVKAGTLSMTQAGDTVTMSSVNYGEGGASTGNLQTVTVKDFRGGATGWSLTGSVTDFKGPSGAVIGAGKLSWTPVCATTTGSPSTCTAGSPGTVGSGATLASAPNGTVTGGQFTADAGLSLDVPAFSATGSYSGVLTLTLT